MQRRSPVVFPAILLCALFSNDSSSRAQPLSPLAVRPRDRIRLRIDDYRTLRLAGNRHPLARTDLDVGAAAPEHRLERMILALQPDSAQQSALEALIKAQHDPNSPRYHQWLTPESFAEHFGVAQNDVNQVAVWLEAHGFQVEEIPAGRRSVIFSGQAAQVASAFHTEIHRYNAGGKLHYANASDPEIPEALAGVVTGVATLHDFRRKPMHRQLRAASKVKPGAAPEYTPGDGSHNLAPADFATIYNVAPLYSGGIDGTGKTIAVVGRSNIDLSDVQTFRSSVGLPANDPTIIVNGSDPGIGSADDEAEANLDVQWAGAVAPMATVQFVVSESTSTTDGVNLSAQYIVSNNLAPVMSVSFGTCESAMGAAERSFFNSLWQQAAAQGITVLVSSGDSGAAGCDIPSASEATGGTAVNGMCSTPYNVCVGGTGFDDTATPDLYWSPSNDPTTLSSALSYIPEVAWNESGSNGGSGLAAGGGGASAYYAKPTWQKLTGVPADGKRDVPDVSLTASAQDGYLIYLGGTLQAVGGTSAATAAFAGLMALVDQKASARQGNANPQFYALASKQSLGGAACFHDVTSGNNSVPGVTGFSAGAQYDLATGLGSVDAAELVNHWGNASITGAPTFAVTVSPTSLTVPEGGSGTVAVRSAVSGGFDSSLALSVTGMPAGVTATFDVASLPAPGSGSAVLTIEVDANAAVGTYPLTITAAGGGQTKTTRLSLVVKVPPSYSVSASGAVLTVGQGYTGIVTLTTRIEAGFNSAVALSASGAPDGVTAAFTPAGIAAPGSGSSALTLDVSGSAAAGTYPLTITAAGGGATKTLALTLNVTTPAGCTLAATPGSLTVAAGDSSSLQISCSSVQGGFNSSLKLTVNGQPNGAKVTLVQASILPGTSQSTLKVATAETAANGSFTLTVTATALGGGLTQSVSIPLTINAPNTFTLTPSPATLSLVQGAAGQVTLTTAHSGTFNSLVRLSLGGVPSGVSASLSSPSIAAPGDGTSTLALQAGATVAARTYSLTITATGGGRTKTQKVALTITPSPNFTLNESPKALSVAQGANGTVNLSITGIVGGFNSDIALSLPPSGTGSLPAGVTATFTPASLAAPGSGSSVLTLAVAGSAVLGTYPLTLTATGGSVTKTVILTLKVIPPPSFTLRATPGTLSLAPGGSVATRISSAPGYVFNATVALTSGTLPAGVTLVFASTSISVNGGTTWMTVRADASATPGSYTITVTGTGGGVTPPPTVDITLNIGTFAVTPAATTVTVARGFKMAVALQASATNGFGSPLSLSVTGLPRGVAAALTPTTISNPASGTSTLTFTATPTATTGTQTITIRATSGGAVQTATVSLIVQ